MVKYMTDTQTQDDNAIPTTVKADLVALDHIFDATRHRRQRLLEKVEAVVGDIVFDTADAKKTEAQAGLISALRGLLSDEEKAASSRVTVKLKHIETQAATKHSASVAALLAQIALTPRTVHTSIMPTTIPDLDRLYEKAQLDPIEATELKTNPHDLS